LVLLPDIWACQAIWDRSAPSEHSSTAWC